MKKNIVFFIIMFICYNLWSQEKSNTVVYNITSCDPHKWNIMFDFNPGYIEIGPIASIGYEIMSEVRVRKMFTAFASFRQPWFSKKSGTKRYIDGSYPWHKLAYTNELVGELQTANQLKPYYNFEVGGGIILFDKVEPKKTDILLKQVTSKKMINWDTYEKKTEKTILPGVDSKMRNIFQIHGGIWMLRTPIGLDKLSDAYEIENDIKIVRLIKDQNVSGSINNTNVSYTNGQYLISFQKNKAYTMMYLQGIFAGISIINVENIQIDALGYGKKGVNDNFNLYLDALYSPSIKIDPLLVKRDNKIDVVYNDVAYNSIINNIEGEYIIDKPKDITEPEKGAFNKKNLGFRLGMTYRIPGLDSKLEGGVRPGPEKMRWYVEFSIGFSIPFTVKALKPSEK
ncbi:MAG: hypothetical protein N2449_05360 [Bacteroidales bacterium]|nr:hypothetical protein [Bacteroidales bacterium]